MLFLFVFDYFSYTCAMVVSFFGAHWVLLFLLFVGVLLVRPCMFCLVGFFPSYPICLAPFADLGATAFL